MILLSLAVAGFAGFLCALALVAGGTGDIETAANNDPRRTTKQRIT